MSLFSIAVQKADALLIVLVCELSASRGSLIDTINPSYRLSWSTLSRWRYNPDCQSSNR